MGNFTLRRLSAACRAVATEVKKIGEAADEAKKKSKSAHEEHKELLQSMAPLIAGYFDTLDKLVEIRIKALNDGNAFLLYEAEESIRKLGIIIEKLGGRAAEIFDVVAYTAQLDRELRGLDDPSGMTNPAGPSGGGSSVGGSASGRVRGVRRRSKRRVSSQQQIVPPTQSNGGLQ